MKSFATITNVGWAALRSIRHQDSSNIFQNCYYQDLKKFQVQTEHGTCYVLSKYFTIILQPSQKTSAL